MNLSILTLPGFEGPFAADFVGKGENHGNPLPKPELPEMICLI